MEKVPYYIFCIKNTEATYKLVMAVEPGCRLNDSGISLEEIATSSDGEARKGIIKKFANLLGIWQGNCEADGIKITEIELLLPPHLEYLYIENNLKAYLLSEYNISFSIAVGVKINNVSGMDEKRGKNKRLQLLVKKDSKLN